MWVVVTNQSLQTVCRDVRWRLAACNMHWVVNFKSDLRMKYSNTNFILESEVGSYLWTTHFWQMKSTV